MANFDLHAHPTSKSFLSDEEENKRISPWDKVKGKFFQILQPIAKSQSNFSQMHEGDVRICVFPIVPIEKGFSNNWLIKDLLGMFLVLDRSFLSEINYGIHSYNELLWAELDHIKGNLQKGDKKVVLLKDIGGYDDTDTNTVYGILAMEGSHALKGHGTSGDYEVNLTKVKEYPDASFLYMTLTHLTWNGICNHAYGSKVTKSKIFWPHPNFAGIPSRGRELIKMSYDVGGGKRLLIDIKHMSAVARIQFYEYREENGYTDIPILASHMGLAGFKRADIVSKFADPPNIVDGDSRYTCVGYKDIPGIQGSRNKDRTFFNPWSINLYDEEISLIIASDGLIGLSLDQRIMGFGKKNEEYFQIEEFEQLTGVDRADLQTGELCDDSDDVRGGALGRDRKHKRFQCNQILHAVEVGGAEAWKHLCLGSDFDGLINAVNHCKTIADYPKLENDLVETITEMAAENPNIDYYITDLPAQVRGIMFENAKNFLDKYFTSKYLSTGVI